MQKEYYLSGYDYELPSHSIAQSSIHPHHDSRLMAVGRYSGEIFSESRFWDIDSLIPDNRVLFFNNSRVLRARIQLENVRIVESSGREKHITEGEMFFLSLRSEYVFEALVRPGKLFKIGSTFMLHDHTFEILDTTESGRLIRIASGGILEFLEKHGILPLPPYVEYSQEKESDYQSIFAEKDGSVAAPTASLHFTPELLAKLPHNRYPITLHVGLGTFQGIKTEDIRDFSIHEEMIEVPSDIFDAIASIYDSGKRIVAVGTTVCRTLESLPYLWNIFSGEHKGTFSALTREFWNSRYSLASKMFVSSYIRKENAYIFSTRIYIYEGFSFQIVEDLITNFHLPKSSLLVLVASLLGKARTLRLYEYAMKQNYRFYSFGDAMYIRGK